MAVEDGASRLDNGVPPPTIISTLASLVGRVGWGSWEHERERVRGRVRELCRTVLFRVACVVERNFIFAGGACYRARARSTMKLRSTHPHTHTTLADPRFLDHLCIASEADAARAPQARAVV